MRLVVDKFEVLTNKKLSKPLKVVFISDTHLCRNIFLRENFNLWSTLRGLKKIDKIDFFVLGGDYINTAKDYLNERTLNTFKTFLTELTKHAPVIMIKGNHDSYFKTKKSEEIYASFANMNNIFLLDNKQVEMFGIKITGFSPSRETYHASKYGRHAQLIAREQFKAEGFKFNEDDFNLILTHSPMSLSNQIMEEKGKLFYRKADVVLSGHMHNGLILSRNFELFHKITRTKRFDTWLSRLVKKYADSGFWYVYKTLFMIRWCRGARFFGNGDDNVLLPSSKNYAQLDLSEHPEEALQIVAKGINKYAVIPLYTGRPSVVELKITPKKK